MLRKFFNMAPEGAVAAPPAADTGIPELAGSEAFSAIDAIAKDDGSPEPPAGTPPPPAAAPPPAPPKPPGQPRDPKTQQFTKTPPAKPAAKPAAAPDPAAPAPLDFDNPPGTIGDLRKHYDALKTQFRDLQTKHGELQKSSTAPKEWPEKKTYEERLAENEKRIKEYEGEIRNTRYEKSQEYKDTYERPYINAYVAGRERTAAMKVVERKTEDGAQVTQAGRQGTAEDFDELMRLSDDDAANRAYQLFGERAPMVLHHRERTMELNRTARDAIKDHATKGEKWEQEQRELSERQMNEGNALIDNFRKASDEKYPALFKDIEGDTKGNELLQRGKHLLERVLKQGAPLGDGEEQWTREELAIAIAAVRNKASGFDRLVHRLRATEKERDALKKDLEAFQRSEPGAGDGGRTDPPPTGEENDAFAQLDKMATER